LEATFGFVCVRGGSGAAREHIRRGAMFDVPRCPDKRHQLQVYSQLQYRRAGSVGATGVDLLFDFYRVEKV